MTEMERIGYIHSVYLATTHGSIERLMAEFEEAVRKGAYAEGWQHAQDALNSVAESQHLSAYDAGYRAGYEAEKCQRDIWDEAYALGRADTAKNYDAGSRAGFQDATRLATGPGWAGDGREVP